MVKQAPPTQLSCPVRTLTHVLVELTGFQRQPIVVFIQVITNAFDVKADSNRKGACFFIECCTILSLHYGVGEWEVIWIVPELAMVTALIAELNWLTLLIHGHHSGGGGELAGC